MYIRSFLHNLKHYQPEQDNEIELDFQINFSEVVIDTLNECIEKNNQAIENKEDLEFNNEAIQNIATANEVVDEKIISTLLEEVNQSYHFYYLAVNQNAENLGRKVIALVFDINRNIKQITPKILLFNALVKSLIK